VTILLDTNTLIWWMEDAHDRLSSRIRALLLASETRVLISAAVAWELAIKVNVGKIKLSAPLPELGRIIERQGFSELPITIEQSVRAGLLPLHHRDPFDRLLVAQAQILDIPIASADRDLDRYKVTRLW
jgi:PIN domain nuclease of toxin-antitoxin system